ncbi:MAG: PASTA domain-containing protein [Clostridia bacterium]|nr:PASTA domain-containing protein [Clostridia bacterium]
MKYRFRVSEPKDTLPQRHRLIPLSPHTRRIYRLRGRNTLRPPHSEPIQWSHLFEIGALPEAKTAPKKKKARKRSFRHALRRLYPMAKRIACALPLAFLRFCRLIRRGIRALTARLEKRRKPKTIQSVPVLCGILCAAIFVTALSAGGVLAAFLLPYHRPYTPITIPDFVGSPVPNPEEEEPINLVIQYEYNPEVSPGTVISQSPRAGVTRRIYDKDGYCTVLLKVSQEKPPYILEELSGMTKRDALLTLTNQNIQATVTEEYSDMHPEGTVLSTLPPAGATLREGATVTLRVSAGKEILLIYVPDLSGLTEISAETLLRSAGFQTGTVSYRSSSLPAGTVISQEPPAHTELERNATVSYTVSAGNRYQTKTVPDLYGMSQGEAAETLRRYGLVIGSCFPVASAAPKGTVMTQSPVAGTPITSSIVSVDLYLSS